MAIDISSLTPQQQLASIYILYYDRAPDPAGFQFWESLLVESIEDNDPDADGLTLAEIATHFSQQQETQNVYDFFDPDAENPSALEFLSQVYANLFGRAPDAKGIQFWAGVLEKEPGDLGYLPTGEILLEIMKGAQGPDIDVLNNKLQVALDWHDSAVAAGMTDPVAPDSAERDAAASALDGVDGTAGSVEAAEARTDAYFGELTTIRLTSGEDRGVDFVGTGGNDLFDATLTQNPTAGGVSNTLSSGDVLNGSAGTDTLDATLVPEFVGNSFAATIDVQPKTTLIENIEIEARDGNFSLGDYIEQNFNIEIDNNVDLSVITTGEQNITRGDGNGSISSNDIFDSEIFDTEIFDSEVNEVDISFDDLVDLNRSTEDTAEVTVDAKDMTDIERIGSHDSDGDLLIENLTTLTANGDARKTEAITVVMDHTDNFNSDGDASDLTVLFDNDYLLARDQEQSGAQLTIELMDLDAETEGQDPLLDNPFGEITFNMNGDTKTLTFGTGSNTYAELLADIQDALADAALTDPDFAQLSASFGPDFQVRDTDSDPNPARPLLTGQTIVITNSGPEILEAVTMTATGTQPAGKDFHTGFSNEDPSTEDFPITVNVELHKAGRGGEGGDLKIGGKAGNTEEGGVADGIAAGIEVFNINVKGAGTDDPNGNLAKPSNIGMVTSTGGTLGVVNIATHPDYANGDTFASLTIRDGFGGNANADYPVSSMGHNDLRTVDASDFFGDLTLGNETAVQDLDTLIATGGGDVTFFGNLTGFETAQAYNYMSAGGADSFNILLDGDALDYAGSSLDVSSGDGKDDIYIGFQTDGDGGGERNEAILTMGSGTGENEQLNQVILDDVNVDGGADDDHITLNGIGNANTHGGDGNDVIKSAGAPAPFEYDNGHSSVMLNSSAAQTAVWAFNFDPERADALGGISMIAPDELPGVGLDLAFLGGATITVTLSGAGIDMLSAGGGVMALSNLRGDAVQGENGYEASFTIEDLINGNDFFGDQRDVNAAVIAAIENDPILSELLTAVLGPNNTLIVAAKDSGFFAEDDLRIDIAQAGYNSDTAGAILSEAQALFGDSTLTISDLFGSSSPSSGADYVGPGGLNASVATSDSADMFYDGLSVKGDDNSTTGGKGAPGAEESNLYTMGSPSNAETDNTHNGGNDDDLIVLSTDGVRNPVPDFETNFGTNNRFLNGASNETIVSDGDNFGYDTIMNFTTAGPMEEELRPEGPFNTISIFSNTDGQEGGIDFIATPEETEQFTLRVTPSDTNVSPDPTEIDFSAPDGSGAVTISIPGGASLTDVTDAFETALGTSNDSGYTVAVDPSDPQLLIFTADAPGARTNVDIGDFGGASAFDPLNGVVELNGATSGEPNTNDGVDEVTSTTVAANEMFVVSFSDADEDGVYTFAGQNVTVDAGDTGAQIAAAFAAGNDFEGWVVDSQPSSTSVKFVAANANGVDNTEQDIDVTEDLFTGDVEIIREVFGPTINHGLDFLDFTYYLTSLEDTSDNPPGTDSSVSDAPIEVTLDYNEDNDLGGSGDGAANADVEANEVAVVRMANDTGDGETFANITGSDVAALFNNGGSFTGFGGDSSFGNLDAADFDVATYDKTGEPEELIGDAKAIVAIENGANHGEYKYFELTWSGDETSDNGKVVSAREIGGQDFGTSLTDLDDVNLVGSSEHAGLDLTDPSTWGL